MSQRALARKYHVSRDAISIHSRNEKWLDEREKAKAKITQNILQKTAKKAADNATLAADIKRKGLLILDKLFEDFMSVKATERTIYGKDSKDIKRLRDLTSAYKDLTEDMRGGGTADSDRPVIVDVRPDEAEQ